MSDDLIALMTDLEKAKVTPAQVTAVVSKGAVQVKKGWARNASGIAHAPRYPASISYDLMIGAGVFAAEIGPDDSAANQGFLGWVLERGGAHSAPGSYGDRAGDAEAPQFEQAIGKLGEIL